MAMRYLADLECGEENPSLEFLVKLAEALDIQAPFPSQSRFHRAIRLRGIFIIARRLDRIIGSQNSSLGCSRKPGRINPGSPPPSAWKSFSWARHPTSTPVS